MLSQQNVSLNQYVVKPDELSYQVRNVAVSVSFSLSFLHAHMYGKISTSDFFWHRSVLSQIFIVHVTPYCHLFLWNFTISLYICYAQNKLVFLYHVYASYKRHIVKEKEWIRIVTIKSIFFKCPINDDITKVWLFLVHRRLYFI